MDFAKLPIGFGMALAENEKAINIYTAMTDAQKQSVLNKAQNARSEREMRQIVSELISDREIL